MRMNISAGTKERLLDAAEEVFASAGYRAASLRAITALAGVNLAAANYHFGSKRGLLEAVFARRLRPFNQRRLDRIAAVRAAIVDGTLVHGRREAGLERFFAFIGRSFFDPDLTVQKAFTGFMEPTFEAMLAALAHALPAVPRAVLFWRLQFVIGAMARVQHLTRQGGAALPRPGRVFGHAAIARELALFVEGGIQARPVAAVARRTTTSLRSAS